MTQYNTLNVKLSNLQLNKLKSAKKKKKNGTEVTLLMKDSSNLIGSSNDETDFPHKLLLTNRVEHIQKELKNSLGIKILQQILMEYKHMIQ